MIWNRFVIQLKACYNGATFLVRKWRYGEMERIFKVVINPEEQYSIWPADKENAPGWRDVGKSGSKEECLAYIEEVWTDMRPLSLRKAMDKD